MRQRGLSIRAHLAGASLAALSDIHVGGTISDITSMVCDVRGLIGHAALGDWVSASGAGQQHIGAEVGAFQSGLTKILTFGPTFGIRPGDRARLWQTQAGVLRISNKWLGRVIDPLGRPIDGRGALGQGRVPQSTNALPPLATQRARLGPQFDFGIRALNCFTPSRQGQRLGIFAGAGAGKSTLLAMLAQYADCDAVVIALVGERGREIREFLEDSLDTRSRARSVVVAATSDAVPLMRRQAARTAMTVAEFFREQGMTVLLLMDSLTRFCIAQREIGLALGEPPASRGYPPSVFVELPKLLERAGPGAERPDGSAGQITALFTVLVEGDDLSEPIADAARGFLDGHIILDRRIAETGRYPAVDLLRSLSRTATSCLSTEELSTIKRCREILSLREEMLDLVRLGAYHYGADSKTDEALRLASAIDRVVAQEHGERSDIARSFQLLRQSIVSEAGCINPRAF